MLSITGYIAGPVRVGGANSPFTFTPDNYASTPFPTVESEPRAEYMVQVLAETTGAGTGPDGKATLADALFGWTKNEGAVQGGLQVPFARFDYASQDGRFQTLPGAPRGLVGALSADANTTRLVVTPPVLADLVAFPIRVAVGSAGSGTTFSVVLVSSAFGAPASGTVELDTVSGALNWNASDLSTLDGAEVHFQRQSFYSLSESNGNLGAVGTLLILNPLPATGQTPAIKIGSRRYLAAVERADESSFSANPAAGTVEWARDTGRLKLNATDSATLMGQPLIYEGVFLGTFQIPRQAIGLAQNTPAGTLALAAPEGSGLYFRVSGLVQFPETLFVDAFDGGRKGQVQVRRSDGAVQLSAGDRAAYAGNTVEAVAPDVEMERGVVLRFFRSVVNPAAADPNVKDVTAVYSQTGATLADPMVAQPFVLLPALPLEDESLVVTVAQGTGSFVGTLSRLDVASPPVGKGFVLDFDNRQLAYAERRANEVLPGPAAAFGATLLPNAPVLATGLQLELEETPGGNDFQPLTRDEDYVVDLGSGVVTYTATTGLSIVEGTASSLDGSTLTVAEDLNASGVQPGDFLVVRTGPAAGLYTIVEISTPNAATVSPPFAASDTNVSYAILRGKEVLADRFLRSLPPVDPNTRVERLVRLGPITNSVPRLRIDPLWATRSRFRFGKSVYSFETLVVPSFTAHGAPLPGLVEVLQSTGDLSFNQADLSAGGDVYWARTLALGVDYSIQPALGFIEFSERMLEREEVYVEYTVLDDDGNEVGVQERGAFLVSKELTQPHPAPTATLSFNPEGREVALNPAPRAFRGGRPQSSGQVVFDAGASTVTFLADSQVTDALPHGAVVAPTENVMVDYFIHEAIGGENNLTVAQPPMAIVQVNIASEDEAGEPSTTFSVKGNRTADFPEHALLNIANSEVYLLAAPAFDGDFTTVSLAQSPPQSFRSDFSNPALAVTSGPIRRIGMGEFPSYFVGEGAAYDTIARGSKQLRLVGDVSWAYVAGTIVGLTDSLTFQEYGRVEGSAYDVDSNRTLVTLATGVQRQHATSVLLRSVRPILNGPTGAVSTSRLPLLALPFTAYRQTEGEVGELLVRDVDFTLDESGRVTFAQGLRLNEEIGLFYTGATFIEAGRRPRASWTFSFVPTLENGLLNQVLTMDYSTYIPDTFFYRIETMTNFRGELVEQFASEAKASSPSQGPILENTGGQALYEKGSPGLFFNERDLENQDLVARPTLKFYNDMINGLEDWFQNWDGRVVGDHDGRFLFDGLVDNPIRLTFGDATNQIDDRIQIKSRIRQAFEAADYSRFYPTQRRRYGAGEDPTGLATGDPILDLGETALRQVSYVRNRYPWAVVTVGAAANSTVFQVDHAQGDAELLRPGLNVAPSLKVAIVDRDGTVIVADASPVTVASTTATSVTLSAPVAAAVPYGATIRMATTDETYRATYTLGLDVGVDLDNGFLTYVHVDDVPTYLVPNYTPPPAGTPLDVLCQVGATNTAPERFPGLDGGTTDDDGDRQFPILSGDPHAELLSLNRELDLIRAGTGTLRVIATNSLVGSGTLTSSTVLSNGGAWSAPTPKVGDLVRLLASTGGSSYFHRVTTVGAADVTVEPAFHPVASGAVSFEMTRGTPRVSDTGTLTSVTVLTDASGNFIVNNVRPGHTVVGVSGTFAGQRRQILAVDSATQVTVADAFTATGAITYQIVDSLATFGGAGSLQANWESELANELRALEGQDFIDFSDVLVQESAGTSTITVPTVTMGAFDALLAFLVLEGAPLNVASATFNGAPLSLVSSSALSSPALYTYSATGLAGITGNLAFTATAAAPNMKVFALKLSSIKAPIAFASDSASAAGTSTISTTIVSREAGDLVLSMACSSDNNNEQYPDQDHNTIIPLFRGSNTSATLRATRALSAKQSISSSFKVAGPSRVSTVIISKDAAADNIAGRAPSEKAAVEAFLDEVVPDRGLGDLVGAITSSTTITGDFTQVAPEDVLYIRHGPNAGVYTIATATPSAATVAESFPASPETNVIFRAGDLRLPAIAALQGVFSVLKGVEAAIVDGGTLQIQQHCPILVYRNGTASGGLPGTPDTAITSVGGRLVISGARARPIAALAPREGFLNARASGTDPTTLEGVLVSEQLYDGRYVWIDARINLETGILPKKSRAAASRQKALERILANLTKLLTA